MMKILSCNDTKHFANHISKKLGLDKIKMNASKFLDGEISVEILQNISDSKVLLTHSLFPNANDNLLQLLLLIRTLKDKGVKEVHLFTPYLPYSRMDNCQDNKPTISHIAFLLERAGLDSITTIDIHSENAKRAFKIPIHNIKASAIFSQLIKQSLSTHTLVFPDKGSKNRYQDLIGLSGNNIVTLHKHRHNHSVKIDKISGDVSGKPCLIIDDIISSGETLLKALEYLRIQNSGPISVVATHNLLGKTDINKLNYIASKADNLTLSNTIQTDKALYASNIKTIDVTSHVTESIKSYFHLCLS